MLTFYTKTFSSRLLVGTSLYPSPAIMQNAIRDYYRVEDEEGRRFWLYRDGLPGDPPPRWFVHGLFA